MALDSNGRIGKWSHMRSNLEEYSWGLGPKKFEKIRKFHESGFGATEWVEIWSVPDFWTCRDRI